MIHLRFHPCSHLQAVLLARPTHSSKYSLEHIFISSWLLLENSECVRTHRRDYHLILLRSDTDILNVSFLWLIKQFMDACHALVVEVGDMMRCG